MSWESDDTEVTNTRLVIVSRYLWSCNGSYSYVHVIVCYALSLWGCLILWQWTLLTIIPRVPAQKCLACNTWMHTTWCPCCQQEDKSAHNCSTENCTANDIEKVLEQWESTGRQKALITLPPSFSTTVYTFGSLCNGNHGCVLSVDKPRVSCFYLRKELTLVIQLNTHVLNQLGDLQDRKLRFTCMYIHMLAHEYNTMHILVLYCPT